MKVKPHYPQVDRHFRTLVLALAGIRPVLPRRARPDRKSHDDMPVLDNRYGHGHYYPPRGRCSAPSGRYRRMSTRQSVLFQRGRLVCAGRTDSCDTTPLDCT